MGVRLKLWALFMLACLFPHHGLTGVPTSYELLKNPQKYNNILPYKSNIGIILFYSFGVLKPIVDRGHALDHPQVRKKKPMHDGIGTDLMGRVAGSVKFSVLTDNYQRNFLPHVRHAGVSEWPWRWKCRKGKISY